MKRLALIPIVPLLAVALAAGLPRAASAQTPSCECTCDQYRAMEGLARQMQAEAEAGEPRRMPPELIQMAMCSQPCAQIWAQCAAGREPAPQAPAGQDAIDQERRLNEAQAANNGEPSPSADAAGLTEEYLEGTWCSVYGGQETTQWQFRADGSYEIGTPAGNGWAMQPGGDGLDAFRQRFERLVAIDDDRFVTEHRHGRNNVFNRGPC